MHEKGYKHFRTVDLINIYEYIKDTMYYTNTYAEQEYRILLLTGILSSIKHTSAMLQSFILQPPRKVSNKDK